jgi:hypothetical protein
MRTHEFFCCNSHRACNSGAPEPPVNSSRHDCVKKFNVLRFLVEKTLASRFSSANNETLIECVLSRQFLLPSALISSNFFDIDLPADKRVDQSFFEKFTFFVSFLSVLFLWWRLPRMGVTNERRCIDQCNRLWGMVNLPSTAKAFTLGIVEQVSYAVLGADENGSSISFMCYQN